MDVRNDSHFRPYSLFPVPCSLFACPRRGFTLLEMFVALGVFSVIMVIAFGIAISMNNAQFKASRIQIVQDDLRFALESMTKEMRTGTNFQGSDSVGNNGYRKNTFRRSDSVDITYCRRS